MRVPVGAGAKTRKMGLVPLSAAESMALVPAALVFTQDTVKKSVMAEMSVVLVDSRTGKVIWRTLAWAHGATPEQALVSSLDLVLPVEQIK